MSRLRVINPDTAYLSFLLLRLHLVVESTSLKVAYLAIIRESRLNNSEWTVMIGKCEIRIIFEKKRRITPI